MAEGFTCDVEEQYRSACEGLLVDNEHDDKHFCVLHARTKDKNLAAFAEAIEKKLKNTAEARRINGSKGGRRGGRGRQSPVTAELVRLQTVFEQMAEDIRAGTLDRGCAAVMIQAYSGARSCLAAMLKAKELEELEVRLTELEERYGHTNGARMGVGYGGLHR